MSNVDYLPDVMYDDIECWTMLPKSGLHLWWKVQLGLSQTARTNFADKSFRDAIVIDCLQRLDIDGDKPLLGQYTVRRLNEVTELSGLPAFAQAISYTAGFLLRRGAGRYPRFPGGIEPPASETTTGGVPLGVIEVRNMQDRWQLGTWKAEAMKWAQKAFELTGGDWQEEGKLRDTALKGDWDDYMQLRQYIADYSPEI